MTTVRDVIRRKGREVFTIAPEASVLAALEMMAKHNIGALLVMTDDRMVGILSERDCSRKVELMGKKVKDTKVSEIMTSQVITVQAGEPLEECMARMNERNIRHLPVFEGRELVGVLSVRDVLREMIELQQSMLSQLERYITGEISEPYDKLAGDSTTDAPPPPKKK